MVRTIYVVFTNKKLSNSELRGMKQYMFLCSYDIIQANELIGYEYMKSCVNKDTVSLTIPHGDGGKVLTNGKLAIIAKYLNGSWEMGAGKIGYFIGKSSMGGSAVLAQVDLTHGIAIYEHKTVQYAGIVYFKNAEDAKKAAKMLGADIRYLFLS